MISPRTLRFRRSCLAVPGSSTRFIEKARDLDADQIFLDLEDSVANLAKAQARAMVTEALNAGGWGDKIRVVRINDPMTEWAYRDLIHVVEHAGNNLDCIMLPKVQNAAHVHWLDLTLSQIEKAVGLEVGAIGIEAQIEDSSGVVNVDAIAAASPRLETLIFGPADFMASVGMRSLVVGEQPPGYTADAYHYVLMRLLMAARSNGLQVIDGPYGRVRDSAGYRRTAERSAALGYDGKWVLHPDQLSIANEIYRPTQADYDQAEVILAAYDFYTSGAGGQLGAVMLGDEMIDEASRKMAVVVAAQGRAAGLSRTIEFAPPAG